MPVNTIEMKAVRTALLIRDKDGLQYLFVLPAVSSEVYSALFVPETHTDYPLRKFGQFI